MSESGRRLVSGRDRERLVVAHRGASAVRPENTRASLARAAEVADYVELDVRCTRDGELVVFHDRTPRRTSDVTDLWPDRADAPISSFTRAELAQLDVGSWFDEAWQGERVLELHEAAAILDESRCGMFVEIKEPAAVEPTAERIRAIRQDHPDLQLAIGSIQPETIETAHRLLPDLPSGVLFLDEHTLTAELEDYRSFGSFVCFRNDTISPELIAAAHSLGWQITHNTNTRAAMRAHAGRAGDRGRSGVDATTTDRPDVAVDPFRGDELVAVELPRTVSGGARVDTRNSRGVGYKYIGASCVCLIGDRGAWCELVLTIESPTRLTSVMLHRGPDGGVVGLKVDGATVATAIDTAAASHVRAPVALDIPLAAGTHTVRLTLEQPTGGPRLATIDAIGLSSDGPDEQEQTR